VVALDLYSDLRACEDEDWFSLSGSVGRPLVVYLLSDDPFASVHAEQYGEALFVSEEELPIGADGCYNPYGVSRNYCKRAEVRPSYEGYVDIRVDFTLIEAEYDLRARLGDEVSASCVDDSDCGDGYECLDNLDYSYFSRSTCSKACSSYTDCGGERRECITSSSSLLTGSCFQECASSADCRDGFSCVSRESAGGYLSDVCVPN
jgi:hypothetical protein